ncbi:transferrin-binding protein-like solute binding protein [Moraxella nasovis]|uniref:transferrin-binding protein-like solute binding protein n=1 Tax=Moraxella nasovis TaxID=2904121 RepID=UPI001F62518B|nr:transferrin-binding protein-like solute binding protein [Moraxella nasovis]UNU72768.1 transferrin-binding protein-like solute binding protein [Moraxella nasovis]
MSIHKRTRLYQAMSVAMMGILTGCVGGDFGAVNHATPTVIPSKAPSNPQPETIPNANSENTDALTKPALGFLMKGVVRDDGSQIKSINTDDITSLGDNPDFNHSLFHGDGAVTITGLGDLKAVNPNKQFIRYQDNYGDYTYVRFGHLIQESNVGKNDRQIPLIYTFYHGDSPSSAMPVENSIHYKGHWLYMSDAQDKKAEKDETINVDIHGADNSKYHHDLINFNDARGNAKFSSANHLARNGDMSSANTENRYDNMIADFTVDFADKKLSGTLGYENPYEQKHPQKVEIKDGDSEQVKQEKLAKMRQPYTPLYKINGDIKQNRFTGDIKSQVDKDGKPRTIKHYGTTYTQKDTRTDKALFASDGVVEGGFYGDDAAELAGKFVTNTNDLVGVFGAKKTTETKDSQKLFDATLITPSHDRVIYNKDLTNVVREVPKELPAYIPTEFANLASNTDVQTKIQDELGDFWTKLEGGIPNLDETLINFDQLSSEEKVKIEDQYFAISEAFENEYAKQTISQPLAMTIEDNLFSAIFDGQIEKLKQTPAFWEVFRGDSTDEEMDEKLKAYEDFTLEDEELVAMDSAFEKARANYLNTARGQISSQVSTSELASFGDPARLRVGGKSYNLNATKVDEVLADTQVIQVTKNGQARTFVLAQTDDGKTSTKFIHVCCDNLAYTKFGRFNVGDMTDTRYFVQGQRSKAIPDTGTATYSGHWTGFIDSTRPRKETDAKYDNNPFVKNYFSDDAQNNTAKFTADFGQKTLIGRFLTGTQPVLDMNAKINGTAFSGTAKTEDAGFTFNRFSTGATETIHIKDAKVMGGFYGDNGAELGGSIHYNNNDGKPSSFNDESIRLGMVFGAKKDEK